MKLYGGGGGQKLSQNVLSLRVLRHYPARFFCYLYVWQWCILQCLQNIYNKEGSFKVFYELFNKNLIIY